MRIQAQAKTEVEPTYEWVAEALIDGEQDGANLWAL